MLSIRSSRCLASTPYPPRRSSDPVALPGPNGSEKTSLERELSALAARIQYLEAKANAVDNHTLPITDRKSTSLNSSHLGISYAVLCFKKRKIEYDHTRYDRTKSKM